MLHSGVDSDRDVIAAVLAGDREAFATLVQRHNQALYRAARAILRDDVETEDALQAGWVQAYRALRTFRGDASFRTWVTRIVVHEASARLRRSRRSHEVPLEEGTMTADCDPARAAASEELGRVLERQLDALPDGLRSVLVLRDVLELDTAETAACLGIAEEAVRVRLHRARRAVSESLVEQGTAEAWRFAGERCARIVDRVMSAIRTL